MDPIVVPSSPRSLPFSRNSSTDDNAPMDFSSSSASTIELVRRLVLVESAKRPEDFYAEDLERIQKSDFQVKRFIVRVRVTQDGDNLVKKAAEVILQNLKWRKEVKILERSEETFPAEFPATGLIGYGRMTREHSNDVKDGKSTIHVLYINTKVYRKEPELTSHFFAYGNAFIDRIDRELEGREKLILFIDLSELSMANADINFLKYYLNLLAYEFPLLVGETIIYEPSWYLKPLVSVCLSIFPKKMVRNVTLLDKRSAIKRFGEEGLPEGAGGKLSTKITPPPNCPSVKEYAEAYNISWETVEKAKKDYNM